MLNKLTSFRGLIGFIGKDYVRNRNYLYTVFVRRDEGVTTRYNHK